MNRGNVICDVICNSITLGGPTDDDSDHELYTKRSYQLTFHELNSATTYQNVQFS